MRARQARERIGHATIDLRFSARWRDRAAGGPIHRARPPSTQSGLSAAAPSESSSGEAVANCIASKHGQADPHAQCLSWTSTCRAERTSFGRRQRKRDLQRFIQLFAFCLAQFTDVVCQTRFFEAHQAITVNGAIAFQALFRPYVDLSGQSMPFSEDGSTDDCRVIGINQRLSTDNHERSPGLCVARRTSYAIQLPPAQDSIHPRLE